MTIQSKVIGNELEQDSDEGEKESGSGEADSAVENRTAKAGKRSAKAIAEAEEKQAKEERKKAVSDTQQAESKKIAIKLARSRLERRSKKYREAAKLIDSSKQYTVSEALELATKTSPVKFDATVEIHIRLGVDPKQADQNIRGNLVLPAGTGKTARIAVFAEEDVAKEALKAGADIAGSDDFLAKLDKGEINFDILIATPNVMARLSKYARVLGPKGLMPNPKSGTVTKDVSKAIAEAKAGRLEYRVDSTGIVHAPVGKVSFGADKLTQNSSALLASIKSSKPASLKGNYVRSITVTTSMGPGIHVQTSEL
jgi:large subunit ribosomal protein L1